MLAHLQAYFCLESLGTKVQLERVGEITHHKGHNWYAQDKPVHHLKGSIRDIYRATKDDSGAHLHVYMCKDETTHYYEVTGRAFVGSLCVPWLDGTSINEKQWAITSTSEVNTFGTLYFYTGPGVTILSRDLRPISPI